MRGLPSLSVAGSSGALLLPAFMQGEYGLKDIFFGVPVQLGRKGIEKIIEYDLNDEEKTALLNSAAAVKETTEALVNLVTF